MKRTITQTLACVVLCGMVGAVQAAPAATYVKTIDISSQSNFPSAIDVYNGDLYLTTFNNKKVIKVASPLAVSPTVSTVADFTADMTWPAGRGMIGINVNQTNGDIYAAGENGTNGLLAVINSGGTVTYKSTTGARYTSFDKYGTTSTAYAATLLASSILRQIDITANPPTETAQTAAAAAPYNANFRDLKVAGDRVYYSRNGTTADGYARYDAVTPGFLAGAVATGIYQTTGTNTVSALGIGYFKDGPVDYVLVPDLSGQVISLVNVATSAVDLTISHPELTVGGLRDAAVAKIGGITYLFATRAGAAPPTGDAVIVFQLTGLADVSDWAQY